MWRNRTIANGPTEERIRDRMLLGDAVGSPSLDLVFTSGVLDSSRIDFQRTTAGTYYRGQFNQNLFTRSGEFADSVWPFVGGTKTSGLLAPDNSTDGVVMQGPTTAIPSRVVAAFPSSSATVSVYTKWISGQTTRQFILRNNTTSSNFAVATVNYANGTISGSGWSIEPAPNGWYRIALTTTTGITPGDTLAFYYGSGGLISDSGQFALWGAQLTGGSLLTPYIPTTTATITEGQIASSPPWNLLLRSQEFDNTTSWANSIGGTGVTPVRTADNAVAPDGTTTADTITFNTGANTTSSDFSFLSQTITGSVTGRAYTGFVWMRGTVGGEQILWRHSEAGPFQLVTLTTSWQRYQNSVASQSSPTFQIGIRQVVNGTINSTATVELWGAQVNEGSSALDYRSTTSSALWLPRFENDPVTGEARGLLIEGGTTNLLQQSAAVRTSPWTTGGLTTAGTSITAPDGTANGVEVVYVNATASGNGFVLQTITAAAATPYTFSIFLKAKGTAVNTEVVLRALAAGATVSTLRVTFDHATGGVGAVTAGTWTATSASSIHVGNGWYRVVLTGTSPATTDQVRVFLWNAATGNGTDGVYAWGAQVEAQSFASSYIPTTTATVARGADSAVMTGTNFSSWYNQSEGTVLAKWRQWNVGGNEFATAARFAVSTGSPNSLWVGKQNAAGFGRRIEFELRGSSGQQRVVSAANPVTDPIITAAGAHKFGGTFGMSYNGNTTVSAAQTTTPAPDRLFIGSFDLTSGQINSTISQLKYWPTRLPNAILQSLTT